MGDFTDDKYAPRRTPVATTPSQSVTAAIESRRTVRQFTDQVVPLEKLKSILRLAARAPSGGNVQPVGSCPRNYLH